MRPRPSLRLAVLTVALAATLPRATQTPASAQGTSTFAARIALLSEPGGHFDTDNLSSNERSYLDVLPELKRRGIAGGAYIGVGPDQNFSYIAAVRPSMAFIIDVRRDNLLLHLLFKALFSLSRTRVEYLALLLGRPVPPDVDGWKNASIERIVAYADVATASGRAGTIDAEIRKFGVPLSATDMSTINRFHRRFIDAGLDLKFQSLGRAPQSHYPTYRDLLMETDTAGTHANYLATEASFQFIKQLHARDLIVPVVGDLAGPLALGSIGRFLEQRHEPLSTLYVSNVEFYLFSDGRFPQFVENLGRLKPTDRSVIIRSVFNRFAMSRFRPGSASASVVQPARDLVAGFASGRFRRYEELFERP